MFGLGHIGHPLAKQHNLVELGERSGHEDLVVVRGSQLLLLCARRRGILRYSIDVVLVVCIMMPIVIRSVIGRVATVLA
jgi:hypothetical protein